VLVDLGSLGSDAAVLVARLRAEPSTAAVPIVALADSATRSALRLAPPAGCDQVLESTVAPSEVAAVVGRWLDVGRTTHERVGT
jgi:CheY-like chemotaxis protein